MNYLLALVGLLIYIALTCLAKGVSLPTYWADNKRVVIGSAVIMIVGTYFSGIVLPYLLGPIALTLAASYLTGSAWTKVVEFFDRLMGKAKDLAGK